MKRLVLPLWAFLAGLIARPAVCGTTAGSEISVLPVPTSALPAEAARRLVDTMGLQFWQIDLPPPSTTEYVSATLEVCANGTRSGMMAFGLKPHQNKLLLARSRAGDALGHKWFTINDEEVGSGYLEQDATLKPDTRCSWTASAVVEPDGSVKLMRSNYMGSDGSAKVVEVFLRLQQRSVPLANDSISAILASLAQVNDVDQLSAWNALEQRVEALSIPPNSKPEAIAERRHSITLLRLQIIDKAWGAIDSVFATTKAFFNVPPPMGGGIAGMDPAFIKDPAQRAAYESAIAQNNEKIKRLNAAAELRRSAGNWSGAL
jgi:hypothetical protein